MVTSQSTPLTEAEVRDLVATWYKKLDVHAPAAEVADLVADGDLEMRFPEATLRNRHEFVEKWYEVVIRRFFDEDHEMRKLDVELAGDKAFVNLVVRWQAKIWDPPAPTSVYLGFDAAQRWIVTRSPHSGKAAVQTYIVDELKPLPGSANL